MANRTILPNVTSNILDYGLGISPEPSVLNDSILIIGTATDGPMYEPIPITGKDQCELIFGSFGDGTLIRGIFEAYDSTIEGTPDIRGMRIGNGAKATLEIDERLSSSASGDAVTTGHNAIKLEAIYPGSRYNAVSTWVDEQRKINIYNPKTGLTTKITFDDTNPNNSNVDARNVLELVEVINSDANLSSVIIASASGIPTTYEVELNSADTGASVINNKTILNLGEILNANTQILPTGYIFEDTSTKTAGNLLQELTEVFSLSVSTPKMFPIRGATSYKTPLIPFDGKGDARLDTVQALEDYNTDDKYMHTPDNATVVSEYMNYINKHIHTDVTVSGNASTWKADVAINGLHLPPDDSQEVPYSGVAAVTQTVTDTAGNTSNTLNKTSGNIALAWANATSGTLIDNGYVTAAVSGTLAGVDQYVNITASGIESYLSTPGKVIVEISETGGVSDSEWTELLYHQASGVYVSGFSATAGAAGAGTITLAIGDLASGYTGTSDSLVDAGLITSGMIVNSDKYLRITCNTVKGFLSEVETLPALEAVTDDWTSYFFRGNEMILSNTAPTDLIVNYGIKVNHEIGSDVTITDSANGEIKFNGSVQPGQGGNALDTTKRSIIGLSYKHLPQFPAITSSALTLDGGTNGTGISNKVLGEELSKAYTALENYNVQIVVPMGAYIDSTMSSYNAITGLPETVNAQFHIALHEYLDHVSKNVNETIGIIGATPAISSSLVNVNSWVKKLTVSDLTDPTRAANIMPLFGSRYVSVTTFEPVFDNIGGLPYTANGQASYAGMVSSLVPHHAPTNKSIPNATRTRFELSNSQLEALLQQRYVAMRPRPQRNPVISSAITAAPPGSDFTRLTTVRITFAAMDVVRQVCDPFIGEPNTQGKRNAMEAAITKGLQGMVDVGALRKYAFTIASSASQQVLGVVEIELILVPVFEIQQIRTTVKLRTEIPA